MNYFNCDGFHIWEQDRRYFLFDIFNLINVEITYETYELLSERKFDKLNDEMKKYFELLSRKGYFFYETKDIFIEDDIMGKEVTFTITPVFECNMQCIYCFANAGKSYQGKKRRYEKAVLQKIAEHMINTFHFTDKFRLSFVSGGEPFYDFRALMDVVDFFSAFFKSHGKNLKIWICTNGTLINEEYIKQLDFYNVQIGISQDGNRKNHDSCRINKRGEGTYELIKKNICKITKDEDLSKRIRKIWGSAVVTSKGEGILPILLEHKQLGFTNSQLGTVTKLIRHLAG